MYCREWNAEEYHRLSDPQFGWGLKVLKRVENLPLGGHERVMDAGCGTGRVTRELLRLLPGGSVVGVDLSINMLAQARGNLEPEFKRRVDFVNADLQALPFQEEFDGVFSTAVFHWAKDHGRLFRSVANALIPGGWLIAQCGGKGNLERVRSRVRALQTTPLYAKYFEGWSEPWEYADADVTQERLHAAGFVRINAWLEDAAFSIDDRSNYREFLKTVIVRANLEQIPDVTMRARFLDELTEAAAREDDFTLDYCRLNIDAIKKAS